MTIVSEAVLVAVVAVELIVVVVGIVLTVVVIVWTAAIVAVIVAAAQVVVVVLPAAVAAVAILVVAVRIAGVVGAVFDGGDDYFYHVCRVDLADLLLVDLLARIDQVVQHRPCHLDIGLVLGLDLGLVHRGC